MAGKLVIFSAPSGAGKTTIVKYLLSRIASLRFSVSATTRAKRDNERDGVDYYFLSKEEFLHRVAKKQFIEFEEVYTGTFYGTLRSEIEQIWSSGNDVIFDMDVIGGLHLKRKYEREALAVFVKPPSLQILVERLAGRATETEQKLKERVAKAEQELGFEARFDVILLNDNLTEACESAYKIVTRFLQCH